MDLSNLPPVLTEYLLAPPLQLSDSHLVALHNRVAYVNEVVEEIEQWTSTLEPLSGLLDPIEVDLLVILGSAESHDNRDTTYLIHSSWPADCSIAAMFESLPAEVVLVLTRGIGKILIMEAEAANWVRSWAAAVRVLLNQLANANTLDSAMASLLATDVLLANLVAFITMMRLNPMLNS
jgi:hypothetical protein